MEDLQALRGIIGRLEADNERLRQERPPPDPGSVPDPLATPSTVTERLVVVPRDRKCPVFNGKTGIDIREWIEELQACMRVRRLSLLEQAFYIFDHLEGEALILIIILIVIRLSGVGSRGEQLKQGAPDFPFPGHIDQL